MSFFRRGMSRNERVGKQRVTELEQTEVHVRRSVSDALRDTFGETVFAKVNSPSTQMAVALNRKNDGPQYAGTVSKATITRRRAANKRARVARRASRR